MIGHTLNILVSMEFMLTSAQIVNIVILAVFYLFTIICISKLIRILIFKKNMVFIISDKRLIIYYTIIFTYRSVYVKTMC